MAAAKYANFKERPLGVTGWGTEVYETLTGQEDTRYVIPRQEVFCRIETAGYGKGSLCATRTNFVEGRHSVMAHLKEAHLAEYVKQARSKGGRIPTLVKNAEAILFEEQLTFITEYTETAQKVALQNANRGASVPNTPSKRTAAALGDISLGTPSKRQKPAPFDPAHPPSDWVEKTTKLKIPRGGTGKPLVGQMRLEIRARRAIVHNDKGQAPCPNCRTAETACPPPQYVKGSFWDTTKWSDSDCIYLSGYDGPEVKAAAQREETPDPDGNADGVDLV